MELVGRTVRKEFSGRGLFSGVVRSYDAATGMFVISYQNGDSEEILDFSRVGPILVDQKPRRGRKPKKRDIPPLPGKSDEACVVNSGLGVDLNDGFVDVGGNQDRVDENFDAEEHVRGEVRQTLGTVHGSGGKSDGGEKLKDLDLNEGLDMEACWDMMCNLAENVNNGGPSADRQKRVGSIDLNLDANDEFDGDLDTGGSGFDLNLGVADEEMKDTLTEEVQEKGTGNFVDEAVLENCSEDGALVEVNVDINSAGFTPGDVVVSGGIQNENSMDAAGSLTDASVGQLDNKTDEDCKTPKVKLSGVDGTETEEHEGSCRKKRRRLSSHVKQGQTVLRRSTRRMSAQNHITNYIQSSSSTALTVERKRQEDLAHEEPEDLNILPPKPELPPSSGNLNFDGVPVLDVFSVYTFLRSFSTLLFLSPFEFDDFVAAVNCKSPSILFDSIHVCLLQTLRKHLEYRSGEGSQSASECLKNLNWSLLDSITWPVFLVNYLVTNSSGLTSNINLCHQKLFITDYYMQSVSLKIEILHCLCDDVLQVETIRSELSRRSVAAEPDVNFDRTTNFDHFKKRRAVMDASGISCLTEEANEESVDWNSDECCLCKMDGSLICCDGCPAAYHSKCVGIANHLLPKGEWFCPECEICRRKPWMKPVKSLRGAELVGRDPHGRLYYVSCGYLLVSDSCNAESSYSYYYRNDFRAVLKVLKSSYKSESGLLMSICKHWDVPITSSASDTDLNLDMKDQIPSFCVPLVSITSPEASAVKNEAKDGSRLEEYGSFRTTTGSSDNLVCEVSKHLNLLNSMTSTTSPHMSSEGSEEIIQINSGTKSYEKAGDGDSNGFVGSDNQHEALVGSAPSACCNLTSTEKNSRRRGRRSTHPSKPAGTTRKEDNSAVSCGIDYVNRYSFAKTALSVAEELTSEKVKEDCMRSEEEIILMQIKTILKKSTKFCWPDSQNLNVDVQREKCGWCYTCRLPTDERDCLVNMTLLSAHKESTNELVGLQCKNMEGHLIDILSYIISIEDRLRGLLSGPWLNPNHRKLWHKNNLRALSIASVKQILLMLEANVYPRALSPDWFKYMDSVVTVGSASHILISSSRASAKHGINRKRARGLDIECNANTNAASGLTMYWWRGGRISRQMFSWKILPNSLVSKAARQAGCTRIPGILYEGSEAAKRSKSVLWRAAVESATSVGQLALQLRELDSNIKWDEIENTHILPNLDKESRKSIRLFKKAIIRRKSTEGKEVKYLIDFGKRRAIPDVVLKHGTAVEEPSSEKKKYWLDKSYVPLHLLKNFEDKRISRKSSILKPGKQLEVCGEKRKSSGKTGFAYLFSKAERSEYYQCGHCSKDVLIREAVSCQYCGGFFHKRHVRKCTRAIAAECTYTCHQCHDSRSVKTRPKQQKCNSKMPKGSLRGGKVQLQNSKKSSTIRKSGRQKSSKKVAPSVPLRRSTRKVKFVSVQNKKSKGKKVGRKGKRGRKPKRGTPKKPQKCNTWRKNRTCVIHSYWFNGLLFSRKPNDKRVLLFRGKNILVPTDPSSTIVGPPSCHLCSEAGYKFTLICCESCGEWFHGAAFGLNDDNISMVIGFRCHICRKRMPPVCPHAPAVKIDEPELAEELIDAQVECLREVPDAIPSSCEEPLKQESQLVTSALEVDRSEVAEEPIDAPVGNVQEAFNAIPRCEEPLKKESPVTERNNELPFNDPLSPETDQSPNFRLEDNLEGDSGLMPASKRQKRDLSENPDEC